MKKGLYELVLHYLEEVAHDPERNNPDQLAAYAVNFVEDIQRWVAARLDFRDADEEEGKA
jgi:hypothetical protein